MLVRPNIVVSIVSTTLECCSDTKGERLRMRVKVMSADVDDDFCKAAFCALAKILGAGILVRFC